MVHKEQTYTIHSFTFKNASSDAQTLEMIHEKACSCLWDKEKKRGMFKKRPNFLNSAPASTEVALRLLSAPSSRFWQQTAICPVLLWALVVEVHSLNWACAQAVRWISYKLTTRELVEQRVCVWHFVANLVKILQRHFNCLIKHTGRTVWAERVAMSGLSILKRAERWSVKIPGLDDLPHQQTMNMSGQFMLWFVEIIV